jgi:hypothetical protein
MHYRVTTYLVPVMLAVVIVLQVVQIFTGGRR